MPFQLLPIKSFCYSQFLMTLILIISISAMAHADARSNEPLAITPQRQPDSWMQRHNEKLALAKQGYIDIVLIGDSITHFWEYGESPKIWDEFFSEYTYLNLGFGGDRTEHVIWRLQNGAVDEVSPKLTAWFLYPKKAATSSLACYA